MSAEQRRLLGELYRLREDEQSFEEGERGKLMPQTWATKAINVPYRRRCCNIHAES